MIETRADNQVLPAAKGVEAAMNKDRNKGAGPELLQRRVAMVMGREVCDLVLENVQVVDVFGREVLPDRVVLVGDGVVLAVLKSSEVQEIRARERVDCQGKFLAPGLMDAHVHIESSLLTPPSFAKAVLPCGTTRVVADPHEIANVCGAAGIRYMLEASRDLPVRVHVALPSCVPCTPFEDAGAVLDASSLEEFWTEERVCSLGEVMNYPGLLQGDEDLLAKIAAARTAGRMVDGHCPGLAGRELQAYWSAGVGNDHEELDPELVREHVRAGAYVFVREGSAAKSLSSVLPAVTAQNAHRFCVCTDDLHAEDILKRGHINAILARAVSLGLDAPTAVSMATINTALCFGFANCGAVAPGYEADLVLFEDLVSFRPAKVWCQGRLAAENGRVLARSGQPTRSRRVFEAVTNTVHVGKLDVACLKLHVPSGKARVIGLLPHNLCTVAKILPVEVDEEGLFGAGKNPGLCKIAVFERHRALGLVGLGILEGYAKQGRLLGGALATSISHDSHNIVAAGSSDEDILLAVQTVAEGGGGIAIVRDGKCGAFLPLPVAGLMSEAGARDVARDFGAIEEAARAFAVSSDIDPVMTLSFMALCVIPEIRVHTRGLFDVTTFSFVPVDAGGEQQ